MHPIIMVLGQTFHIVLKNTLCDENNVWNTKNDANIKSA